MEDAKQTTTGERREGRTQEGLEEGMRAVLLARVRASQAHRQVALGGPRTAGIEPPRERDSKYRRVELITGLRPGGAHVDAAAGIVVVQHSSGDTAH